MNASAFTELRRCVERLLRENADRHRNDPTLNALNDEPLVRERRFLYNILDQIVHEDGEPKK